MRRAAASIVALWAGFAAAGEWITTEGGARVCRLEAPLSVYQTLTPAFCSDWQPPFRALQYGEAFPFHQGWIRNIGRGGLQLHTERGWVP